MSAFAFVIKDPDKAYLGTQMWLPIKHVNKRAIKASLEFEVFGEDGVEHLQLWEETEHHLAVPREYIPQDEYTNLTFPIVDLTPTDFPRVEFRSKVILDFKAPQETTQRDAWRSFSQAENGILNLACVAGDTQLRVNRGGKGFRVNIADAFKRLNGLCPKHSWDEEIETFIRSNKEGVIGLQKVKAIIYRGKRQTYTLKLRDGKSLRLTSDHEVLTTSGTNGFMKLGDLRRSRTKVIVDGKRKNPIRKPKPKYKRLSWYSNHPFARKQERKGRAPSYVLEEHRVVAECMINGISTIEEYRKRFLDDNLDGLRFIDPNEFHVHHIDEDTLNNHPDNLEILKKEDHLDSHRPGAKAFGYGVPTPVEIASITLYGVEDVYDLVCEDPHRNFVANGIVVHNCGKGKTCLALHAAEHFGTNMLIIVNQNTILDQWIERIHDFLEFEGKIGTIQGDPEKWTWRRPVCVAMLHTLARYADHVTPEMRRWFGYVVWDEVHHLSAPYFCITATMFPGRRFGLSATVKREDGTEVVYDYHIGDVFHKDLRQEVKPTIRFRQLLTQITPEDFLEHCTDKRGQTSIGKMRTFLGVLEERNIAQSWDLLDAIKSGRKVLALSHSKKQLYLMNEMFKELGVDCGICTGDQQVKKRWTALRDKQLVFGTHQLVMEAIDEDTLDTLFWLTPFGSQHPDGGKNALQQGMGRIQGYRHQADGRQPLVVIYDDIYVVQFHRMCNQLRKQLKRWPQDEGGPYEYVTLRPRNREDT